MMNLVKKHYMKVRRSIIKRRKTPFLYKSKNYGKLLLIPEDEMSRTLYCRPLFEEDIHQVLVERFAEVKLDAFLDVGANYGIYSILAYNCGIKEIYAFEPNPKTYLVLATNLLLNGLEYAGKAWEIAASSENGTVALYIDPKASDVSTLDPKKMPENYKYSRMLNCSKRKIDDLLSFGGKRIFIKIDVEGHEEQVIAGMLDLIRSNDVDIMVEVLEENSAVDEFLRSLGMRFRNSCGYNYFYTNFEK